MYITDKIRELIKEKGITAKQFSEEVHISKNTLRNWENAGQVPPSAKNTVEVIARYFHVPVEVLTGEERFYTINVKAVDGFLEFLDDNGFIFEQNDDGTVTIGKGGRYFRYAEADFRKMCSDFHEKADPESAMKEWADKTFPTKLNPRDYFRVETAYEGTELPVYGDVSAGPGAFAEQRILGWEESDDYEDEEEYFYLIVSGDSMYPELKDGDYVLVHVQDWIEDGQIAVVVVDGEGLVKKIERGEDYITLVSINPHYPPRKYVEYDMNRVHILGHVVEVKRKFK